MELKDVLTSLFKTKEDLATEIDGQRELVEAPGPWVINRMISLFPDCVGDVNEINTVQGIDAIMQYDFLRFRLKPRTKTFTPWLKAEKPSEDVKLVMEYYKYSEEKAREAMDLLTDDQLELIRESFFEGGVVKKRGKSKD